MFTLWYSVLSFKEYRNTMCSGDTCSISNDVQPSAPKSIKPTLPVEIPKAKVQVPDVKPNIESPTPVRKVPSPLPSPQPSPTPVKSPVAPASPRQPQVKPSTPPASPNRLQQSEQQQENRNRGFQPQPSPLAARKPQVLTSGAQASQQFLKRENSYSSEEEDEDEDEEEDSEIERIDLHQK